MSPESAPLVGFVEDDASFRRIMGEEIERMGFRLRAFPGAAGVADFVARDSPPVLLLDLKLPDADGLELLGRLLAVDAELQVVVLTGHGAVGEAVQAMRAGAFDFLTKPVSLDVLEQCLRKAVATAGLLAENRRLRRATSAGGERSTLLPSAAAAALERLVERVAATDENVLISGESGVGKELVARALHSRGRRRERAFVPVNCGAISAQIIESELFGHRRGAFTGAEQKREGLFVAADGGTLFLDEIGELPLEVQPTLLRAIQFGEVRPVGAESAVEVDVRVVAATNRDLRALAAEGKFREDLYFRLAILEIDVPPLRERREDIAILARRFLARESARGDRRLELLPDALDWLSARDWPGNVRELENAMVRVAVLAEDERIDAERLRSILEARRAAPPAPSLPAVPLRELERRAVEQALARHGGNKRRAAEELGIAVTTLYAKLERGEK